MDKLISGPVVYAEARLSARFERYLGEHGRKVIRYRITYPGLPPLYSDLADATVNVLYEAKGSAARMSVRLAIGELLDYGRRVPGALMAPCWAPTPRARRHRSGHQRSRSRTLCSRSPPWRA